MSKPINVQFEGQTVPAIQLEYETQKEPWSIYELEDGTVLKLKSVLGNISRLVDRYKDNGEPVYVFQIGGLVMAEVPESLKKKKEDG